LIKTFENELEEYEMSGEMNSKVCARITANLKGWLSDHTYDFDDEMKRRTQALCSKLDGTPFEK
jgi:hypothetical protein